jgi:hypothetical protein
MFSPSNPGAGLWMMVRLRGELQQRQRLAIHDRNQWRAHAGASQT